ncbi:MAG: phosphoglucosamine mutase [Cytophagaceae bacterium]|jgi:phosphomannomutase|nr:phosphoglucosamine mutase [Cytophagaceae bacterium]
MTLIKSISGIRGTIGGKPGEALTPIDVVQFAAAYGTWALEQSESNTIVIGRDARLSGPWISTLVVHTLRAMGVDIVDLGLSTTPTVEMAVEEHNAAGGIIITASHNPAQWNALKLLNSRGEFVSEKDGKKILTIARRKNSTFADVKHLGKYTEDKNALQKHIEKIVALPLVNVEAIRKRNFTIAIDAVNSSGGIAVPLLLEALGVRHISKYFCEPDGHFPHNPEPLPENLTHISSEIQRGKFDLGIVVDPDVDRLCFVNEDGSMFGEEYTLVAIADYVLKHTPGNTVSNLSSTQALQVVTEKYGKTYTASAVGEVNVVTEMKRTRAVIGGEGNGGVIYPELHYGRDALVGIALFLSHLAEYGKSISMLRASYPTFHISKNKIELTPDVDVDCIIEEIKKHYKSTPMITVDGVRFNFESGWVHLRKSNTEPIIRIYSESNTQVLADNLAKKIISDIKELMDTNACLLR